MTDIDGDFIRKLRWEFGWSQRELAKKLGVTPGSVGQWESSMTKPGRKNQERLKDLASKAKQSLEDDWEERITGFRLTLSTDKFSIKIGEGETRVTPFIKVSITNFPPLFKESVEGKLEVNPVYQSSLDFFRKKVESHKLKSSRDYEFVSVDKEVILTPLNESAWENLKPWKLSDEELLELWSNRNTE